MKLYNRTTTPETLLVFDHAGCRYVIRQDRKTPGLFHRKHEWPSGARWWRPISPGEWASLPEQVRRTILDRFPLGSLP